MKIYRIYDDDRKKYITIGKWARNIWQREKPALTAMANYVERSPSLRTRCTVHTFDCQLEENQKYA